MTLLTASKRGLLMINTIQLHGAPIILVAIFAKQHTTMWEDHKKLTNEEKKSFFTTSKAPEAVNLRSFVQPEASVKAQIIAKQKCSFVIDGDTISTIIVDLLLTTPTRIRGGDEWILK
jgi:hypothetical protein